MVFGAKLCCKMSDKKASYGPDISILKAFCNVYHKQIILSRYLFIQNILHSFIYGINFLAGAPLSIYSTLLYKTHPTTM